jgi:hypothetical protein
MTRRASMMQSVITYILSSHFVTLLQAELKFLLLLTYLRKVKIIVMSDVGLHEQWK